MERARDVTAVALRLLPHVDYLHRALLQQLLQLAHLDHRAPLVRVSVCEVAGNVEQADGPQPAGGELGLGGRCGVERNGLVEVQEEPRLGREGRA